MNVLSRPFRWIASRPIARSLRFRLILLVLLASLPSLGLLFITASQQRDDALATGQATRLVLARLVAADQSSTSGQIELVMTTLARSPELRIGDDADCSSLLRALTVSGSEPVDGGAISDYRIDNTAIQSIVVLDAALSEVCSSTSDNTAIPGEDRALAMSALDRGRTVVGNYRNSSTGSLVVTYATPVSRDDEQARRVLVGTFEVYALSAFARQANLPAESFIVIFDDEGTLEQLWPFENSLVAGTSLAGTPVVDSTIGTGVAEPEAEEASIDVNGEEFVIGSDDFWTPGPQGTNTLSFAMVGLPNEVVVERANEKFNENLGRLGIAGIVALVAAWIGADLFVGRDLETRKRLIRDLYHAFSTGSINELDQIIGPGYADRTPSPGQADGVAGLQQNIAAFRTAFPQGQIIVRDLIAEHDKVVARVTLSGTHIADYFGVPPSGKHVVADGVETFRFAHGMVVESWSMFGELRPRNKPADDATPAPPERTPGLFRRLFRRASKRSPGREGT